MFEVYGQRSCHLALRALRLARSLTLLRLSG
jgi:hypothetical protein